jgi:hypothetical protein
MQGSGHSGASRWLGLRSISIGEAARGLWAELLRRRHEQVRNQEAALERLKPDLKTLPGLLFEDCRTFESRLQELASSKHIEHILKDRNLTALELIRRFDKWRQEKKARGEAILPYKHVGLLLAWAEGFLQFPNQHR